MAKQIALSGVMKDRICATVRLERTLCTSRQCLVAGSRKKAAERIPSENAAARVAVYIPETKGRVVHFRKHACFIARVHVAFIVVHEHAHTGTRGGLQVNVPG